MKGKRGIQKPIVITAVVLILICTLYLMLFELPLMVTPLRNKPDEIIVYCYGQSVVLHPEDHEFDKIYQLLRDAGKGTIAHAFQHGEMYPCRDSDFKQEQYYLQDNAIVVYAKYHQLQKESETEYSQLAFVMEGSEPCRGIEKYYGELHGVVPYSNGDGVFEHVFVYYGSLERVRRYIETMGMTK